VSTAILPQHPMSWPVRISLLFTWPRVLTALAALVAAAAAMYSGMSTDGGTHLQVVLPLIAAVAIAFAVLAFTRFGWFVLLVLGIRSCVDAFKMSGASAGNTANNTATARGADPSTILAVLFLLSAGLWLAAQYAKNGKLTGSKLRTALVMFFAAGAISVLGSTVPTVSAMAALRILAVVLMYVVLEQVMVDRAAVRKVLIACYASMVIPLGYTMYGFLSGHPQADYKGSFTRITGPMTQSTTFARYLGFMIIFGFALLPTLHRRARIAMYGVLSLSTVFLMLTLTRGAMISTLLGVVLVAIIQKRTKVIAGLIVAALLGLIVVPGLASRLSEVGTTRAVGGAPTGNTLAWRINYWTQILPLANSNPINGIGLDRTQYQTVDAKQPHNDFIRAYVETGILGLATYILVLVRLVGTGRTALRRAPPGTRDAAIAVGFLACAIAFIVESAAANVISSVVCLWYLVAFAAAASAVARFNAPRDVTDHPTSVPSTPTPALAHPSTAPAQSASSNS
jgi:putative inorganic carbon (hco3(-)) transporter